MGVLAAGSQGVKSFSRQTGQQELVVWSKRDARLQAVSKLFWPSPSTEMEEEPL